MGILIFDTLIRCHGATKVRRGSASTSPNICSDCENGTKRDFDYNSICHIFFFFLFIILLVNQTHTYGGPVEQVMKSSLQGRVLLYYTRI